MQLSTPAFIAEHPIPSQFTCEGVDRSPALAWSDPPEGTSSFALIVDDPDAPMGVFGHWGAYDIDAGLQRLEEGAGNADAAPFRQARNDFGVQHYRGPCPPHGHGPHRYRFKLFALDVAHLGVGQAPRLVELEKAMDGHILARAVLTATYERN